MSWIILRTAPRSTLKLSDTLNEAGFECWTPAERKAYRAPRSSKTIDRTFPMMPTFVFANAVGMLDLYRLSKSPAKAQPDFSLFKHKDRVPVISDTSLQAVRDIENKTAMAREKAMRAKLKPPSFRQGEAVAIPDGPFAGLSGRVEEQKGRSVIVCFGRMTIEVDAWQIVSDELGCARIAA